MAHMGIAMKRWSSLLCLSLLLAAGCSGLWTELAAAEIASGLLATPDYRGQMVERGILPDRPGVNVVREVVYGRPGRILIRTLSPADRAGDLFIHDGTSATYWYAAEKIGVRVRGITPPDESGVREHVHMLVAAALKDFAWSSPGAEKVLGRPVTIWQATPLVKGPAYLALKEWRDNAYEWPLRLSISADDGSLWYGYEFTALQLPPATPVAASEFTFDFPPNALVFEWDLHDAPLTLEQARTQMNFTVREMKALPPGRSVRAHVKARGQVPMLMSLADGGGSWLALTQNRSMTRGPYALAVGKPVQVGAAKGYANFAAGSTWISWVLGDTELQLSGNLPWSDMLTIAQGVQ
jgi:hypothetical protein